MLECMDLTAALYIAIAGTIFFAVLFIITAIAEIIDTLRERECVGTGFLGACWRSIVYSIKTRPKKRKDTLLKYKSRRQWLRERRRGIR